MLYATGTLNHLLGHRQLGNLLDQLYDLDNTTGNKQTKPQRDMGSNPSTKRNYKSAVNSKNKMQMLCMRCWTTTNGSNRKGIQGWLTRVVTIRTVTLKDSLSKMASAYYSNTQHIDFESVLAMDDPVAGQLVKISEEWFAESFDLPVDGLADLSEIPKDVVFDAMSIVSMSGEPVSLSGKKSQMKVEYRLLCDIMAKSISVKAGSFNAITVEKFSMVTAVVCGVRMNWARVLFNILKKMVTPGSKQSKGFAVHISLLLENIPNLELGESSEFPASKILTEKTVHRYVSLNDKVGAEEASDAPQVKKEPRKPAASTKRPVAADFEARVVKQKRTIKKKSGSSKVNLEIMVVAQEAVPIQMVESSTAAPAAEGIFTQLAAEYEIPADPPDDEVAGVTVDEVAADEGANEGTVDDDAAKVNEPTSEPAVVDIVNEEPSTGDEVDDIIEQVFADTAQIIVDEEDQVVHTSGEGNQPAGTAEERHWFDLPYDDLMARWDAERPVVTASDTDEDVETMDVGAAGGDQQVQFSEEEPEDMEMSDELIDADEKMSLDEILLTIPAEHPLPSSAREVTKITIGTEIKIPGVDENTWYLASLPQIPVDDKGKEPLQLIPNQGQAPAGTLLFDLCGYRSTSTELKQQAVAHRIRWTRPCCSILFEGRLTSHRDIPAYTIFEVSSQRQYDDTLPLVCDFFKLLKKWWGDVCLEAVEFCASRRLLPVGSLNFCRDLAVVEPDSIFDYRQPTVFALRFSQLCTVYIQYSLFSRLTTADISSLVASIASERTVLRNVQIAQNTVSVAPIVQLIDEHSSSNSTSDDISMDFADQDTAAAGSISLPAAPIPDVTKALNQLRASIDQIRERDDGSAKHKDTLLLHLHDFEKQFIARFDAQDRVLGALCRDSNDQRNLLSLELQSSHKQLGTQINIQSLEVALLIQQMATVKYQQTVVYFNSQRYSADGYSNKQMATVISRWLQYSLVQSLLLLIVETSRYILKGRYFKRSTGAYFQALKVINRCIHIRGSVGPFKIRNNKKDQQQEHVC
ncbi:hypothetical protein F511_05298 [Dorcoceras hygrometricum]|uniref:Dystroglycan-like n=1 Tax=Dorcoceras hygrometricum TaxID=472368 RepID=A0A2Z7BTR8_9LAMI|nr:hypothetical protein F511_05298 [Dorcoceras hygrometricum]